MELFCPACDDALDNSKGVYVLMTLSFPGEGEMSVALFLCWTCSEDYKNEKRKPVIEALCSAKVARLEEPERSYKPGSDAGPGNDEYGPYF